MALLKLPQAQQHLGYDNITNEHCDCIYSRAIATNKIGLSHNNDKSISRLALDNMDRIFT